ncbi:MAG: hypothetical protein GY794_24075 [bacterium]|nr:hypothetical protein [bacterium]
MCDDPKKPEMHPVEARFRNNARGFWKTYKWILIVFFVSLLCDAASTTYFMLETGPESEIHPVVRVAARIAGPVVGPLFGALAKACAGIIVGIYCRRFAIYILVTVTIISFWAAWYNIWGIKLYNPMIMQWLP